MSPVLYPNLYLKHQRKCVLDLRNNFMENQYQNMELGNKINTLLWGKQNKTKKLYCKSHKKPHSRSVSQKKPPPKTISVLNGHNKNKTLFVDEDFIGCSQNSSSILPPFIILYPNHKTKTC